MGEALTSIFRQSGARGLLQGFGASVLRDAPYAGLYVLFYELIKDKTGTELFHLFKLVFLSMADVERMVPAHMLVTKAAIYTWSGRSFRLAQFNNSV